MHESEIESFSGAKKARFLFSIIFVFLLPICVLILPIFSIMFNLLFFPFTLIHELGHLCVIALFLPSLDPQLEFHLLGIEFCCACVVDKEFPLCWQTIISMFAGSFSVVIFVILCNFTLFRIRSGIMLDIGKYYLIFGLLSDLPNLLPILPSSLGFVTDGFAINTCLYQMGYPIFFSTNISNVFSFISIFLVLASFFFLGQFLCCIGQVLLEKLSLHETKNVI